ncbi:PREDICTED: pseudouridylate synthase 7 homolog [Priapulus caudatus]|uniref:Pseudouridylate synthase 7 homolog n=1 Tax=Priapulus caudatus TaxID=37621 RepID=A0ABM1ECX2_PRICU|nr:PREDICTED: pseudouridylate synthase 7 homolog [Priapulus caudatus]
MATAKRLLINDGNCETGNDESLVGASGSEAKRLKCDDKEVAGDAESPLYFPKEVDVGITEYVGRHQGFFGVVKQRYSDFVVNEVDTSEQVLRLNDVSKPECASTVRMKTKSTEGILSEEDLKKLDGLEADGVPVTLNVVDAENKAIRTKVHNVISQLYMSFDSETIEKDGKKVIVVSKSKGNRRSAHSDWPSTKGQYCHFLLYKENRDTADAINTIARLLRQKNGSFAYAGTKDKRGKTTQAVSAYRVRAELLHGLNTTLKGITLGNFHYEAKTLRLGQLKGNQFTIVLRNVTNARNVDEAMASLRDNGFINYYGMQRFGTTTIPTHHVGRALLLSKWQEAVELILKPREGENDEISESRRVFWETRNAKVALEKLHKWRCVEGQLLRGLAGSRHKNDFLGAITSVQAASGWGPDSSGRCKEKSDGDGGTVDNPQRSGVRALTEDEVHQYDITDIVLPLPGYDITYPANEVADWYKELLAVDGLSSAALKHKVKDYALPGAYRKILVKPTNLSWKLYGYHDNTLPLTLSDLDRLNMVDEPESIADGLFEGLRVEFSLPSSSYATMALREVLKIDTSAAYQTTLNDKATGADGGRSQATLSDEGARASATHENSISDEASSTATPAGQVSASDSASHDENSGQDN